MLPHTVGVDFDTAQAQRLFQQAQEGETVEVPLTVTQPDITQEILARSLALCRPAGAWVPAR